MAWQTDCQAYVTLKQAGSTWTILAWSTAIHGDTPRGPGAAQVSYRVSRPGGQPLHGSRPAHGDPW